MKKNKKHTKKQNILNKLTKKTKIIIAVLMVSVVGVIALNVTNAGPNDGWQRIRVVNAAIAEIGNREWNSRVLSYTEGRREPWCADFVSYVYRKAGYQFNAGSVSGRSTWRIPLVWKKVNGVPNLRDYSSLFGAYRTRQSGYTPGPGDIIIFGDNDSHAGIVEKVAKSPSKNTPWVYTIEGNISDGSGKDIVGRKAYAMTDPSIHGYGALLSSAKFINTTNAPPPPVK